MPIQTLAKRAADPFRGLICLGTLNKGMPRTTEQLEKRQPGSDLDYFRVQFADRFAGMERAFRNLYGDKPKTLEPVLILGNTPDQAFSYWREQRGANGRRVVLRCDEVHQTQWQDVNLDMHHAANEEPPACPGGGKNGGCPVCQYAGRLSIVLPDLLRVTGVYGYFYLHTGSQFDIAEIRAALEHWYGFGDVNMIPFVLGREDRPAGWRSYTDKKDQQRKQTPQRKNLLYLHPTKDAMEKIKRELAAKTGALPTLAGAGAPQIADGYPASQYALESRVGASEGVYEAEYIEPEQDYADQRDSGALSGDPNDPRDLRLVERVTLQRSGNKFNYVVVTAQRHYILFTGELFRALGYEPNDWKQHPNQAVTFSPPVIIAVDGDEITGMFRQNTGGNSTDDIPF